MSDEIKENGAAATVVENLMAMAEVVAEASPTAEDVAAAAETVATADKKGNTKPTAKEKAAKARAKAEAKAEATGALRAVGLAACKRHGLKQVWVTDDSQCFAQENDARAHGKNLANPEILKVEAE